MIVHESYKDPKESCVPIVCILYIFYRGYDIYIIICIYILVCLHTLWIYVQIYDTFEYPHTD